VAPGAPLSSAPRRLEVTSRQLGLCLLRPIPRSIPNLICVGRLEFTFRLSLIADAFGIAFVSRPLIQDREAGSSWGFGVPVVIRLVGDGGSVGHDGENAPVGSGEEGHQDRHG
jgi:hypothetical protein